MSLSKSNIFITLSLNDLSSDVVLKPENLLCLAVQIFVKESIFFWSSLLINVLSLKVFCFFFFLVGGRFNEQGNLHTWQRYSWWSSWLACLVHIYHKFLHLVLLPESVHFLFSQKTFWHKIGLFFAFQAYFSEIIQMFHSC